MLGLPKTSAPLLICCWLEENEEEDEDIMEDMSGILGMPDIISGILGMGGMDIMSPPPIDMFPMPLIIFFIMPSMSNICGGCC